MYIVRAVWSGFPGAPGYSNFAFNTGTAVAPAPADVDAARQIIHDVLNAAAVELPPDVKIDIDAEARIVEPTTGALIGLAFGMVALVQIPGRANLGTYTGSAGGLLKWLTGGVQRGRLVRGRTFIVPMSNEHIINGQMNQTAQGNLQAAAALLVAHAGTSGSTPGVWARPLKAYTSKAGVVHPAAPGAFEALTGAAVNSVLAVLRSRRD